MKGFGCGPQILCSVTVRRGRPQLSDIDKIPYRFHTYGTITKAPKCQNITVATTSKKKKLCLGEIFILLYVTLPIIRVGSALIWVAGSGSGSAFKLRIRIQEGKKTENRIFMFWSAGCSLLRAEGFFCSLGVLYGGLGISKLQFLIKKIKIKVSSCNLFSIFGHQTLDTDSGSGIQIRN